MIYVVSGFMRSGTSMMMQALEAGGLEAAFAPQRDEMNQQFGDEHYQPNPGGFYEMTRQEYLEYGFPRKHEGKLLKCLWGGLPRFVVGSYLVAFMLRDPEEIRQSFEAFFNRPAPPFLEDYQERMRDGIDQLRNRKDTEVAVLEYREVVDKPRETFEKLKNAGWPINVDRATGVIQPDLCRFRREDLTVGI